MENIAREMGTVGKGVEKGSDAGSCSNVPGKEVDIAIEERGCERVERAVDDAERGEVLGESDVADDEHEELGGEGND